MLLFQKNRRCACKRLGEGQINTSYTLPRRFDAAGDALGRICAPNDSLPCIFALKCIIVNQV
jgi:hypothetical protein